MGWLHLAGVGHEQKYNFKTADRILKSCSMK